MKAKWISVSSVVALILFVGVTTQWLLQKDRGCSAPVTLNAVVHDVSESQVAESSEAQTQTCPSNSAQEVFEKTIRVKPGETLAEILGQNGIDSSESHLIIEALSSRFNPRDLKAGQDVLIRCKVNSQDSASLLRLMVQPGFGQEIVVSRSDQNQFHAGNVQKKLVHQLKNAFGNITSSLYADASKAGVPAAIITEATQAFSYAIHLQRDVQENDPFEVLYENTYDSESGTQQAGNLVYAAIGVSGTPLEIFRYQTSDGTVSLFNDKGESLKRALLVTPVKAARLSSGYGMRHKHPVLGYSRMHRGVDFAAPRGTPVMASGEGTIVFAGKKGGYGNYVMIDHHNGYQTVYAHLNNFGKNVRRGHRVKQGDIIGAIGMTGMTTGPHLHYETLLNGKHMDPQKIKQPPTVKLSGKELKNFYNFTRQIKRYVRGLTFKNQLVMTPQPADKPAS